MNLSKVVKEVGSIEETADQSDTLSRPDRLPNVGPTKRILL